MSESITGLQASPLWGWAAGCSFCIRGSLISSAINFLSELLCLDHWPPGQDPELLHLCHWPSDQIQLCVYCWVVSPLLPPWTAMFPFWPDGWTQERQGTPSTGHQSDTRLKTERQTTIQIQIYGQFIITSSNHNNCMCLDCRRKPEYTENTCKNRENIQTPQQRALVPNSGPSTMANCRALFLPLLNVSIFI